jgi:predicted acyl esterase
MGHTGYRLRAGHRLRLHVASSDFPLYVPHPGDGQNPWHFTTGNAAGQTLRTGGSHPSYVSLHVLDRWM